MSFGDVRSRSPWCWDQFLCPAFARFTYEESLRDIEACLRSWPDELYHMGIRAKVWRSTLTDAGAELTATFTISANSSPSS